MWIFRGGRNNIWWSWRVPPVAPRIVNGRVIWRGQIMRAILRGRINIWWSWSCAFPAGAAFREILGDSGNAKSGIFWYKILFGMGREWSRKRRVRDQRFYPRIIVQLSSLVWRKQFLDFSLKSWIQNSWQAQYLVMLEADLFCSVVMDASCVTKNHSWESVFVAGAVFGGIGRWCPLYWMFHMSKNQSWQWFSGTGPKFGGGEWFFMLRALY